MGAHFIAGEASVQKLRHVDNRLSVPILILSLDAISRWCVASARTLYFPRARRKMGDAKRRKILQSIRKADNKARAAEKSRREKEFEKDLANALEKQFKAELETGFDGTSVMNQRVKLTAISMKKGNDKILDAEIDARAFPTESKDFIKEFGEGYPLENIGIGRKKYYLKVHEANRMIQINPTLNLLDAMKKTSDFKPFSQEAKALLV